MVRSSIDAITAVYVLLLDNQDTEVLEMDDAELLASLEAQEVVQSLHSQPESESGYGTLGDTSAQASSMASVRSLVSLASARWVVNSLLSHCSSLANLCRFPDLREFTN